MRGAQRLEQAARMPRARGAVWHDVECAAYAADLGLWRALAAEADGPVLDVGCGTGRVALDLAAAGFTVVGLDSDPDLLRAFRARARSLGLPVTGLAGDARSFSLGRRFAAVIAPMQVVQLLGGPQGRAAFLRTAKAHLEPGGLIAAALADPLEGIPPEHAEPPLPDLREEAGWVFQSRPLAVRSVRDGRAIAVDRLRQAVSPAGDLEQSLATIELDTLAPETLEREARAAGLAAEPRRAIAATEAYVSSTVVVLRREGER